MPDIQSEMSKVLDEWNKPESTTMTHAPHGKITNNVTRATFDKVVQNPGITRAKLIEVLADDGFKKSSTSSIIGQLLTNGNLRRVGDGIFANQSQYEPRYSPTPPTKRRVKKDAPVAQVKAEPAPQINSAWDAETLLNHLSIKQARALYDELRKIFGG
jgi:hypothetical protein